MTIINPKTLARLAAIQTVYSIYNEENPDILENTNKVEELYESGVIRDEYNEEDTNIKIKLNKKFFRQIVENIFTNFDFIESKISENLTKDWSLDRIHLNLKSILVCAISELLYITDVPPKVVVSEYTNIASSMISESEIGFVNSILDSISKEIRK
jgi:N utilization substance protein B